MGRPLNTPFCCVVTYMINAYRLFENYKNFFIAGFLFIPLFLATTGVIPTWSEVELFGPYKSQTSIENLKPSVKKTAIAMPYLRHGRSSRHFSIKGRLQLAWSSPRSFNIVPDDLMLALTVNGHDVDLTGIPSKNLRNVSNGFNIDLSDYLHTGQNDVVFEFQNFQGDLGISMTPSLWDWRLLTCIAAWFVLMAWIGVQALRLTGVSWLHSCLYLLIIVGAVIQTWYIFTYNPISHIWSDPQRHWEQGTDILRLDLMSMTDPIGYQLYVAVLAKLTLKMPGLVAFYTSVLALLGPWMWYLFLRQLQSNKTYALAGWAFFSLLPSWMAIYAYFMQETLMIPLMGMALWASWRCRRKADLNSFLLMVVLWVLVGLTRGVAIPMAAVVCTWLWLAQDHRLKKALYSSGILLLLMGPLVYRSYQAVAHFAPHGMGHLNVIYSQSGKREIKITARRNGAVWHLGFASPATGAKPFYPFSDWKTSRKGVVYIDIDLDKGSEDWDREKAKIDMSFDDYLWIVKENLILLFFDQSWPDSNSTRVVDSVNAVSRFLWAPFFLMLIVGVIVYRKQLKGQWMLPTVILMWFIVQGLTPICVNEGRYRKPFEGLAIAQLALLLAARRGMLRVAAPAVPLNEVVKDMVSKVRPNKTA